MIPANTKCTIVSAPEFMSSLTQRLFSNTAKLMTPSISGQLELLPPSKEKDEAFYALSQLINVIYDLENEVIDLTTTITDLVDRIDD